MNTKEALEYKRFKAINAFHNTAFTDYQKAWATIKCEPTAWHRTKLLMLYETAPDYVKVIDEALNELESLQKPPTTNEVCMELSKHYKEQVSYNNERHNHMFYFEKSRLGIIRLRGGNIVFIQSDYHKTNNLPPHIITLIGRFYEGLEK